MNIGYGPLKAGQLVVNEHGDLVLLTADAHYLTGEYNGLVLRLAGTPNEIPVLKFGEAINWSGKIFRVVGHIDEFLTDLHKLDLSPAEKPEWMLSPEERIERLEAKLAGAKNAI